MNIKCNYCGEMFDETLEKCPSCGAPNGNVKRSTVDQPTTIEELKDWYRSKGLPSYETTRFFIGIDYKGPRAFGIYKDEYTGKCVVYKNKGNGQRAVRYEGTDEAYAVNELFMRLKQEILEQKSRNLDIRSSAYITPKEKKALEEEKEEAYKTFIRKEITKEEAAREAYLRFKGEAEYEQRRNKTIVAGIIVAVVICLIFGYATFRAYVKKQIVNAGYYKYNNEVYYHGGTDEYSYWFKYDTADNDWYSENVYDLPLVDKLHSRKYFVSEEDYSDLGCSDVKDSVDYKIAVYGTAIGLGYYKYGDHYYYHAENDNSLGWFKFNNVKMDWDYSTFSNLPEALQHQYSAVEYLYDFNGERYHPFTDVKQSQAYKITYPAEFASYPKESKDEGYYSKDGKIYYHNDSYASKNWYEYNSTTSQWEYTYQVPDDVESYSPKYYGIKDFTETEYYSDAHPWENNSDSSGNNYSYSSNSNSGSKTNSSSWWSSSSDSSWDSDSSWSWSSSDSWDSGSTDWSSDW